MQCTPRHEENRRNRLSFVGVALNPLAYCRPGNTGCDVAFDDLEFFEEFSLRQRHELPDLNDALIQATLDSIRNNLTADTYFRGVAVAIDLFRMIHAHVMSWPDWLKYKSELNHWTGSTLARCAPVFPLPGETVFEYVGVWVARVCLRGVNSRRFPRDAQELITQVAFFAMNRRSDVRLDAESVGRIALEYWHHSGSSKMPCHPRNAHESNIDVKPSHMRSKRTSSAVQTDYDGGELQKRSCPAADAACQTEEPEPQVKREDDTAAELATVKNRLSDMEKQLINLRRQLNAMKKAPKDAMPAALPSIAPTPSNSVKAEPDHAEVAVKTDDRPKRTLASLNELDDSANCSASM